MRAAVVLSAVALLASACEQPLPPQERGSIVVPATPQATGAAAPLVAPTTPYETSGTTQRKQEESGYFPNAGAPLAAPATPYQTSPTTQTQQEKSGYFPSAGAPLVTKGPGAN